MDATSLEVNSNFASSRPPAVNSLETLSITATPPDSQASEGDSTQDDVVLEVLRDFKLFQAKLLRSGVALQHKVSRKGAILPAKCTSRYFHEGRKTIMNKLYPRLPKSRKVGVHLVLTTDPKQEENHITATARIWKRWKTLRDSINISRRRDGKEILSYCSALEFQKSGNPHLHVFFPGLKYLAPHDWLSQAWGSHVWVSLVPASVAGYVMKYVTKLESSHLHLLWASKARLYAVSQWFYTAPWKPSGEWDFLGLCCGGTVESLKGWSLSGMDTLGLNFSGKDSWDLEAVWDSICRS